MNQKFIMLKDPPKYEAIRALAERYPATDPQTLSAWLLMLRVASQFRESQDAFLGRHAMSQGRWTILMILNHNPELPLNPCDIADKSGVTRATITGLLDGLEREELITRESTVEDRRMIVIRLTRKGQTLIDTVLPDYLRLIDKLMSPLTESDKVQLAGLLSRLGGWESVAPPMETADAVD